MGRRQSIHSAVDSAAGGGQFDLRRIHLSDSREKSVGRLSKIAKTTNPNARGRSLLKKLRRKDDRQIELERKEQGFSVYVNGANSTIDRNQAKRRESDETRPSKTAGKKIAGRMLTILKEFYLRRRRI